MFLEHGIKLDKQFSTMPIFERKNTETFNMISAEASANIQSCFVKLFKIIRKNGLTLWKVFNDFDRKKGSLTLADFSLLMKKLSGNTVEISDQEIRSGFELIDEDNSDSIEFSELNKYYSKINGIPVSANDPRYEPMQIEAPGLQFEGSQSRRQNMYNQPSNNLFQQIGNAGMSWGQGGWNNNYGGGNSGYQGYPGNHGNMNQGYGPPGQMNQSFPSNQSYPQNYYNNQSNQSNQPGFGGQQGQGQNGPFPANFNPFDLLNRRM